VLGRGVQVPAGAHVERCVVGDGATVAADGHFVDAKISKNG
jgi:ADP-glucose pyrophosphorylase